MKNIALISPNMPQALIQDLSAYNVKMGGVEFYIADYNNQTTSLPGIPRLSAVCFMRTAGIFVTPF